MSMLKAAVQHLKADVFHVTDDDTVSMPCAIDDGERQSSVISHDD